MEWALTVLGGVGTGSRLLTEVGGDAHHMSAALGGGVDGLLTEVVRGVDGVLTAVGC